MGIVDCKCVELVWSAKYGVECGVLSVDVKCEMLSVECKVWRLESGGSSVKCSVKCGVGSVDCGVQSVECGG